MIAAIRALIEIFSPPYGTVNEELAWEMVLAIFSVYVNCLEGHRNGFPGPVTASVWSWVPLI